MCENCEPAELGLSDFENSPVELEEYQSWLQDNPGGTLDDFRQSDDWVQIYLDLNTDYDNA